MTVATSSGSVTAGADVELNLFLIRRLRRLCASRALATLRDEPIPPPWHGDDVLMVVGPLTERLPQDRNVPGEPALLDDGVTPDPLKQLVLGDDAIPMSRSGQAASPRLGSQRHGFSVAQQEPFVSIQANGPNS